MASTVRSTALRAGGACVRCRKGKTKCVYENGRAPCKNCAKGMHECYLPSESMTHGGHGVSPARLQQRARESMASDRAVPSTSGDRQAPPAAGVSRHVSTTTEKYVPFPCRSSPRHASSCTSHFCTSFLFQCVTLVGFAFRSSSFFSVPGRCRFCSAHFFSRSRLPPCRRFLASPLGARQAPFFLRRPSFPKPASQFLPCSVRIFPSHPRFSWPLTRSKRNCFAVLTPGLLTSARTLSHTPRSPRQHLGHNAYAHTHPLSGRVKDANKTEIHCSKCTLP